MKKIIIALFFLAMSSTIYSMHRNHPTRLVHAILGSDLYDEAQETHTPQAWHSSEILARELQALERQMKDIFDSVQALFKTSHVPENVVEHVQKVIRHIQFNQKRIAKRGLRNTTKSISNLHTQLSELYESLRNYHWPHEKLACLRAALGDLSDVLTDQSFVYWLGDGTNEDPVDADHNEDAAAASTFAHTTHSHDG